MSCPKIRLYVPQPYAPGQLLALEPGQSHYLAQVMRCRAGDTLAVFNGADGEWLAGIAAVARKSVTLEIRHRLSAHMPSSDLWLAFAPIKGKTERVVEKAVELGVSALLPVFTRRAVVRTVNREKLAVHAVEAAEQSGRHDVPRIEAFADVAALLAAWPPERTLLFADEGGGGASLKALLPALPPGRYGVLVGSEGGFDDEERRLLRASPRVRPFSLGPRILRADTASVAALACVQAWLGDWAM